VLLVIATGAVYIGQIPTEASPCERVAGQQPRPCPGRVGPAQPLTRLPSWSGRLTPLRDRPRRSIGIKGQTESSS
jgi:hypothetical protein